MNLTGYSNARRWFGALLATLLSTSLPGPALAVDPTWREVEPDNLVFMELHEGQVVIELNPAFAPKTVEQFRRLVQERFYEGLSFYRVIDGFVAQGGDGSDLGELSNVPLIGAEEPAATQESTSESTPPERRCRRPYGWAMR